MQWMVMKMDFVKQITIENKKKIQKTGIYIRELSFVSIFDIQSLNK